MRFRLLLVFIGLFFVSDSWSETGILDRVITVEIKNTPIKTILQVIEKRASVQFSYNPDLIGEDKIVSLSITQKTIRYGLSLIFNKSVRFKEVGNHIVLLKNEDLQELRDRKKSSLTTQFKGTITDKRTGKPISGVSIYDVDARYAAVSDQNGKYLLEIPKAETIRSLYIRKKGYNEFVFVIDVSSQEIIEKNVQLEPREVEMEKIAQRPVETVYTPIEDKVLSGEMVSYDTYVHTQNLSEIKEMRWAQISLVPSVGIGSNLSTNGLITNRFSLNVLAGYSNGVAGAEVAGLLNFVKGDVRWFQAAGIGNIVGGNLEGMQVGGIFSSVRGNGVGLQAGGVNSAVGGHFTGVQVGGILALGGHDFLGAQIGGISTISKGRLNGLQVGGVFTATRCGFDGLQVAGISGITDSASYGLQISGIHSTAYGSLRGGQISGISNFARRGTNFFQVAGIVNIAENNKGLQVSGMINHARSNNGLQIGLINTSYEGKGIAIGLINFSVKGFHKTEVAANEIFPVNLTLKSGVRHFYNTYHFGMNFGDSLVYSLGAGFGSNLKFSERWSMSMDLSAHSVFMDLLANSARSELFKFSTTVDFRLAKWITAFVGPSYNVSLSRTKNAEGNYNPGIGYQPFYNEQFDIGLVQMSLGGQVGLRF